MSDAPSVLTLVKGRQPHLLNLISGLQRQRLKPAELVVASMQTDPLAVPAGIDFPIRVVELDGHCLPLAAARNRAASAAQSYHLIFLDVDCIPSASLVESYRDCLNEVDACLMGEVRYLPELPTLSSSPFAALLRHASRHPARPATPESGWQLESTVRSLWGLSFALRRQSFIRAGGFDERFIGYGGEETDFAERLNKAEIPLAWCANAVALHQHHAMHSPPLTFFNDIIRNARLFHATWGTWCMDYWLNQFADMGLINWHIDDDQLLVLRSPTSSEIENALLPATALWG